MQISILINNQMWQHLINEGHLTLDRYMCFTIPHYLTEVGQVGKIER